MARSRNIKPGFFKNYDLADAGPIAQLLFAGLWCLADRDGRLEDKPRLIKAEIFPYYDADVDGELTVIERLGFVKRYTHHDAAIIQILNFVKHQNPHHTEKASSLPAFDESSCASHCSKKNLDINGSLTVNSPLENGEYLADSLIPDSLLLIPDSPIPETLNTDSLKKDLSPPLASTNKNGTRLPADWVLPKDWGDWALSTRPELTHADVRLMADTFRDHWLANANRATGKKADWLATWRNWVRNQKQRQSTNFMTADQRRMASTDKAIEDWLNESSIIEGEKSA